MERKLKIILLIIGIFIFCGTMGVLFGEREPEQIIENTQEDKVSVETQDNLMPEQYVDLVGSQSVRVANAFEAIRLLGAEPTNDSWYTDLLNETTIILNACDEAKNMEPPEKMLDAHKDYLEGMLIAEEVAGKLKEIALSFELNEEGRQILATYQKEMENAEIPIRNATNKIKMAIQN